MRDKRKAFAGKQRRSLGERQADDARIGAHQPDDESAREPLDRVTARLAAPFAAIEVGGQLVARKALEADACFDEPRTLGAVGVTSANPV